MTGNSSYYWAGGRRVPLTSSDHVAVDLDSGAGTQAGLDSLRQKGNPLIGSLVMVTRVEADEALGSTAPGVFPVFRTEDGSLLAVLPEVRVEGSPARLAEVSSSVAEAHVTEQTDERLVLVPDSGRGEDALRIANELAEAGDVDVSQARFVRVVARPGT
jgi:hypothetical protein